MVFFNYPKFKVNFFTYYSPVRYVKNIQLACVKQSTSVYSEPGSNPFLLLRTFIKIKLLNIHLIQNSNTIFPKSIFGIKKSNIFDKVSFFIIITKKKYKN